MIGRLLKRFRRKVPRDVAQAATVLLLMSPEPRRAWQKARARMWKAEQVGDVNATDHWWAVRREIEDRTSYRHGADVATRYLEDI